MKILIVIWLLTYIVAIVAAYIAGNYGFITSFSETIAFVMIFPIIMVVLFNEGVSTRIIAAVIEIIKKNGRS